MRLICSRICLLFGFALLMGDGVSGQINLDNHAQFDQAKLLNSSRIYDITDDKLGFLWVSTNKGVYRFDGIKLRHFFNGPTVQSLHLADSHRLVFIHNKGFTDYNYVTGERNENLIRQFSSVSNNLYDAVLQGDTTLVMAGQYGLIHYNMPRDSFYSSEIQDQHGRSFSILSLESDMQNDTHLWLGSRKHGLLHYDINNQTYEQYYFDISEKNLEDNINTITAIYDTGAELIIGTWYGGVLIFNRYKGDYDQFFIQNKELNDGQLSTDHVLNIIPFSPQKYLITSTTGVVLYNSTTKEIEYRENLDNTSTEYENPPIFFDSRKRLWMGREHGLRLVDTLRTQFDVIRNPFVNESMWEIPFKILGSTDGENLYFCNLISRGLYNYTRSTGKWRLIEPDRMPAYGVLRGQDMMMENDTIWYLEENTLYYYPLGGSQLKRFAIDLARIPSGFRHFTRLNNGNFLFLSPFEGLYEMEFKKKRLRRIDLSLQQQYSEIRQNQGDAIYADADGNVWMCWKNLILLRTPIDSIIDITAHFELDEVLNVQDIFETDSHIWFAIPAGVYSIDKSKLPDINIKRESDRNSSEFVVDDSSNIWSVYHSFFMTPRGSLTPVVYGINDGCHNPGRYGFEQIDFIGGQIVLASRGKYSIFNPQAIKKNQEIPLPYIDQLWVNGLVFRTDTNMQLKRQIELDSDENNIRFDFSAIGFTKPLSVKFRYKLVGIDDQWMEADIENTSVTYANLDGGRHEFRLQAANDNNIWSEMSLLQIDIAIPIYKRLIFWLCLGLVSILWLIMSYRKRIERLRMKTNLKFRMMNLEKSALRAQMNPHFVFNALTSIQHLITENDEKRAIEYLSIFSKLLRGVLDNSRSEKTKLESELSVLRNYLDLEFLRLGDQYTYKIKVDENLLNENVELPSFLLQPFIENAVHHGLAHKDGPGHLTINIIDDNVFVLCIIEDNGIGRTKSAEINKYKDRKSSGLSIVEERLKLLSEEPMDKLVRIIDLEDKFKNPTGTRVELRIPIHN